MARVLAGIKMRIFLFLRHLGQATSACLVVMTKGNLHTLTLDHWKTALYTGAIAGFLALLFAFERWLHLQQNRWFFAIVAFFGTFIGDFLAHPSHFGGPWGEPLTTAAGAAVLSLMLSSTAVGNYLVRVAEPPKS
ncbi:MAG: hypothetical protein K9K68_01770 [Methylococcaceae bacterium]|nr:hypothetical protein [Methylococcaceae bacterium]